MSIAIKSIQTWIVEIPLDDEWASSPEFGVHGHGAKSSQRLLLRIVDEDGFEGWGENHVCLSEEDRAEVFKRLPGIVENELRLDLLPLWKESENYWLRPNPPSPYAPPHENLMHRIGHPMQKLIESTLSDLIARRAGIRLCELWGGAWRESVSVDYWMGRVTPEHAHRCVTRAKSLGFRGVKLKTTLEDPNVERLEAIREAGGDDFHVTVDPNGRFYRLDDALPTIRAMDAVGNMAILEDPFPRFHLEEFAALRSRVRARVAVHIDPPESLWAVLTSGAAGGLNISYGSRGPGPWRRHAGVAAAANLAVWFGSGLDLGVETASQLHLAASTPNCTLPGDQAGPWLRKNDIIQVPFQVEEGKVLLPAGPGSGVEVNRSILDDQCICYWESLPARD